jgi:hypothetical protein
MAGFDPDAYLAVDGTATADEPFDPDKYLAGGFDPNKYLKHGGWEIPPDVLAQSDPEQYATPDKIPFWANNAAAAAVDTIKGFIPHSVGDVAKLLTPLTSAPEEIKKNYAVLHDWISGDKSLEESQREHMPEMFILKDAEQTPPFSRERFAAGFQVLANMGMAASIARGMRGHGDAAVADVPTEFDPDTYLAGTEAPNVESAVPAPAIEEAPAAGTDAPTEELPPETSTATAPPDEIPTESGRLESRSERPLTEEDKARAAYYAELEDQASAMQGDVGHELWDAVQDAGGLPSKNASARETYGGELDSIEESLRDPTRKQKTSLNKIFRKDAPSADELALRLRERGFNVEGIDDVTALIDTRIRTDREIYGIPTPAELFSPKAGAGEGPLDPADTGPPNCAWTNADDGQSTGDNAAHPAGKRIRR